MSLKKTLGLKEVVFLSVASTVGSGIFLIPSIGARILGFFSIFMWMFTGLIAIMMSMLFAELASMYDESGGVYTYVRKAFGERTGFVVGWTSWIISWITIAMLMAAAINYLGFLIPLSNTVKVILSIFIVSFMTFMNIKGIKYGALIQLILTTITFIVLIGFVLVGLGHIDLGSMVFHKPSFSALFVAAAIFLHPYIGWETTTFLGEETKNARKIIPKGIVIATIIISLLYLSVVLVSLSTTGLLENGLETFSSVEAPLGLLAERFMNNGGFLLSIGAIVIILGCLNSWVTTSPRLPFVMARDNMLPDFFGDLNKNQVPANALIVQFIMSVLIMISGLLTGGFELFLSVLVPISLIIYCVVYLTVLKLRKIKPNKKRYFRMPFVKPVVAFSIMYILLLMIYVDPSVFVRGATLVALGIPFFFLIKLQKDKKFQARFFNKFSWFWDNFFPIWYEKKDIKKIIKLADISKNNKVLEFGAGSGLTTPHISKKVGKDGIVVSTDISYSQLEKAKKRIEDENLKNVVFIAEDELSPFEDEMFDSIISVCVLEHFINPIPRIKKLLGFLKKDGSFCFLSFGNSMGIPAPKFLKNKENIEKMFEKAGYDVKIVSKKRLFSQYWFIYGKR